MGLKGFTGNGQKKMAFVNFILNECLHDKWLSEGRGEIFCINISDWAPVTYVETLSKPCDNFVCLRGVECHPRLG